MNTLNILKSIVTSFVRNSNLAWWNHFLFLLLFNWLVFSPNLFLFLVFQFFCMVLACTAFSPPPNWRGGGGVCVLRIWILNSIIEFKSSTPWDSISTQLLAHAAQLSASAQPLPHVAQTIAHADLMMWAKRTFYTPRICEALVILSQFIQPDS